MKNISHITINTGNIAKYADDSVIMDEIIGEIQKMVDCAKKIGGTYVLDGTVAKVAEDVNLGVYMATLYTDSNKETPILETAGALTEAGAEWLWDKMLNLHQIIYGNKGRVKKCPTAPFICDLIYPTAVFALNTLDWTGDFAKCFGIEMLKAMENERKQADDVLSKNSWNELPEEIKMILDARESVKEWMLHGFARKGTFKGLPEELKPYQYWLADSGNVVMVIPECHLQKAMDSGCMSDYEVGVACSYVLKKGYRFYEDYVIVDVPYDSKTGICLVEEEDW